MRSIQALLVRNKMLATPPTAQSENLAPPSGVHLKMRRRWVFPKPYAFGAKATATRIQAWAKVASVVLVLAIGIFLRLPYGLFSPGHPLHALEPLHPAPKMTDMGFDEGLYCSYVATLSRVGLLNYPSIVDHYTSLQKKLPGSILPPVRFLYIFSGYFWHFIFGSEPIVALRAVASLFSILLLILSGLFAWRLKGPGCGLGVLALMSCAPTQIHMSQHALVDGFFAFWAILCLWLLWENLHAPRKWPLLVAYTLGLALLVLTKENAFFVLVALMVIIALNRWLQFGTVTRELFLCSIAG